MGARRRRDAPGLDIVPVLMHFGADDVPTGTWRSMRCPMPEHDDRQASARVNTELGAFACHGCGAKGDAISLLKEREGLFDYASAVARYEELSGASVANIPRRAKGKRRSALFESEADYERDSDIFSARRRRRPLDGT